jgi:hypothetical protein
MNSCNWSGNEEIQFQKVQACHVQGNQAVVILPGFIVQRKTRESGFLLGRISCFGTAQLMREIFSERPLLPFM